MKANWEKIKTYSDIKFELFKGVAKITINRPEVYNAFRPETNMQMLEACLLYTSPSPRDVEESRMPSSA